MSRAVAWVETYGSSGPLRVWQPVTKAVVSAAACCSSSGLSGVGSAPMRKGSRSSAQSSGIERPVPRGSHETMSNRSRSACEK